MQALFKSTGMTLMSNVGGASGPLYGFGFIKMASAVNDEIDHDNLKEVLKAFADGIQQRGKVELNEKRCMMLSNVREKLLKNETVDLDKLQSFANETKDMVATKGRIIF